MDRGPGIPPPPTRETCYRHPGVETGVHCTRCGRPICPDCMTAAAVGHHCPTCLDEARREFRQGPGRRIAVANAKTTSVTTLLLIAIGAMYVVEVIVGGVDSLFGGPNLVDLVNLGASIDLAEVNGEVVGIANGQYWRLFTAIFLHAGLIHLAMNAYVLYIFGPLVERELGRIRFLAVFVVTGIVASAATYAFGPPLVVGVGASGAIFGVVGAFVAYAFRAGQMTQAVARLRALIPFLLINAVISFTLPQVDWRAHLGGFLAGLVAGFVAEGAATSRKVVAVLGFAALLGVAALLVSYGTSRLGL